MTTPRRTASAISDASRPRFTHFDADGSARMVDVSAKPETERLAAARGIVRMRAETLAMIRGQQAGEASGLPKGDVLGMARVAGIMAAKRTSELIPLCHPLPLSGLDIQLTPQGADALLVEARVRTVARTGVEMEALTAVAAAALTVYDMCKAVDRGMRITDIHLARKTGGASGDFRADAPAP